MEPEDFLASLSSFNFGNNNIQQSPLGVGNTTLPVAQETNFFGQGGGFGNIMAGFNALSGLAGAYTGLQQLNLAEDSFNFNRGVTQTNLNNQANTVNSDAFARLQRQSDAQGVTNPYASLEDYVKKSGAAVSGTVGG